MAFRGYRVVLGAVGVAAAVVAGWFVWRGGSNGPGPERNFPFRECATEVFRPPEDDPDAPPWQMHFLSDEQGEPFRINLYDHGCGLAVGDYDGDGRDDIYFCNQLGKNALYHNNGDGTFTDVADKAGVGLGDRICVAATWADTRNSGLPDLYVTSTRGGNVLFRNNGDSTFTDVTDQVGLTHVGHSQTPVFFDYDNDGYLDLFLCNTAEWTGAEKNKAGNHFVGKEFDELQVSPKEFNVLYHNVPVDPKDPSKGRKFVDVTEKAGLKGRGWAGDAVAFDYNDDGHIDLFVTGMFNRCQMYRNDPVDPKDPSKGRKFTDVTLDVLGKTPYGAVGCSVFDSNNNGRLDLFAVDMHSDMWMGLDFAHRTEKQAKRNENKKFPFMTGPNESTPEQQQEAAHKNGFSLDEIFFGNGFYRNEGGGKFTEVSDKARLETFWPWGITTGDFTNRGRVDVFIPSGMGYPFYYWPNQLLMNQGDGTFREMAEEMGVEPPPRGKLFQKTIRQMPATRSSRCAVTGDFRGEGRLDIVVNNFNDQPYYFKNQAPRQNYIAFRLEGRGEGHSNRDALGAVVRLYRGKKEVMTRPVLGACGYLSQSSRTVHFGLGDSPDFDRVEVTWPRGPGHKPQVLKDITANRVNRVPEPEGDGP